MPIRHGSGYGVLVNLRADEGDGRGYLRGVVIPSFYGSQYKISYSNGFFYDIIFF